jgi:hypothetical protein
MNIFELTSSEQFNLMGIAREIKGTQSHKEIIDIVEKHFSVATVEVTRTPKLDVGELSIGAHYDPESDEEGDDAVFINIFFSKDGPAEFTWGKESKKYFLYKLKDTLKHDFGVGNMFTKYVLSKSTGSEDMTQQKVAT